MTAVTLFPSVLGVEFSALDSCLRWVHSGESRRLRGFVTVKRGTSVVAKVVGVLARISATIDSRDGRYHFFVDSELRGIGRIVRYEGLLDAAS